VIKAAGIVTVKCVESSKLAGLATEAPFQRTAEAERKPFPVIVRVKSPEPTSRLDGERFVRVGTGLLIESDTAEDSPPPGVEL